MALGYLLYVLPAGAVGYIFLFVNSQSYMCQKMNAPFLLDNNYEPAINMTELYELRVHYAYDCDPSDPYSNRCYETRIG